MTEEDTDVASYPRIIKRRPKWHKLVFSGVIIATVFCAILLVVLPMLIRTRGPHLGKDEISNARQIGIALLEFETEYGAYPGAVTASLINASHGYDLSGTSSNAVFRQFIITGLPQSEQMFYARIPGTIKPDGIITPGEALKKGEVGFSYIAGLSSKDDPTTPIVLTPLIPGTTKFDPKPFDGKAIILHIDNSVRSYDINKDGHIYDAKGINLLSPKNPVWKGKSPDIRYPEL